MEERQRPIERIEQLVQWLIEHRLIRSTTAFERVCGLSVKYMSNSHFSPKGGITVDILARIYETFPIFSLDWAVTGKGQMFKKKLTDAEMWQLSQKIMDKLKKQQIGNQTAANNK